MALVGALLLSSCSGYEAAPPGDGTPGTSPTGSAPSADPAPSTTGPGTPEPSTPEVLVEGVPEPVRRLVEALYRLQRVPATEAVTTALGGAEPPGARVQVTGVTGEWEGVPYAVLTSGDDLTLAVAGEAGWRVVGGSWPSLGVDETVLGGPRHVLLIGSDAREKQGQPVDRLRADSLQVVGVDGTGGGGVMGIARDAWVEMPKGGHAKINNAMVEAGPEGQVATVERTTGLPLDGYVLVGFEGFKAFVDDWGGVKVDAPKAFDGFREGEQRLTGYWLLRWARHRKTLPGGDFERSFHQGLVLAGMGLQVRAAGPLALPEVLDLAGEHMQTDLGAEQVLTLAGWAFLADPARFGHEVARGTIDWSGDGQSIVRLDEAARATFQDFADGNLRPPAVDGGGGR
jgi:polyisoprenyl-teichoic acid--peptidoglycan teichoic acid transferase